MSPAVRAGSGATVWLTGLSGAGKSTIAAALGAALEEAGSHGYVLDGDDLREGLNADLGFSAADRAENVRRVGEVALLLSRADHITIVSMISPYRLGREGVRGRHQAYEVPFLEVHVATSIAECERRDPKHLYARARAGELSDFTGVSGPYEVPERPELRVGTADTTPEAAAAEIVALLRLAGVMVSGPGSSASDPDAP